MKATDHNAKLSDESLSNESASFDNIDIEAKHCNNLTADNITSELNPASVFICINNLSDKIPISGIKRTKWGIIGS